MLLLYIKFPKQIVAQIVALWISTKTETIFLGLLNSWTNLLYQSIWLYQEYRYNAYICRPIFASRILLVYISFCLCACSGYFGRALKG